MLGYLMGVGFMKSNFEFISDTRVVDIKQACIEAEKLHQQLVLY